MVVLELTNNVVSVLAFPKLNCPVPRLLALVMLKVPAEMVTPPEKVLAPLNTKVPAPVLVTALPPLTIPETARVPPEALSNVVLLLITREPESVFVPLVLSDWIVLVPLEPDRTITGLAIVMPLLKAKVAAALPEVSPTLMVLVKDAPCAAV